MTSPGWTSSSRSSSSSMFSVMSSATSRRTGDPNRRRASSRSSALQQILVAVLLDLDVGVAGDPERVVLDDLQAREQHRQECRDQFLHRQEPHGALAVLVACPRARQFDEPVDVVGHLDSGEVLGAVLGLADGDRQVQAQPADERERVGGVDGQRRQHREDLLVEVRRQPARARRRRDRPRSRRGCPPRPAPGAPSRGTPARAGWRSAGCVRRCGATARAGDRPSAERTDSPISSRRLRPATRTM